MSPAAALVLDWVITALWPLVGKAGASLYSVPLFMEAGLLVGALCLAPWLRREGRIRRLFSLELALPLAMIALFSGTASMIYVYAVGLTTPANAAIMAQVEVLYSAALCAYFLRERVTAQQAAASVLVLAGTALILSRDLSSPRWKGDLIILLTPWMFQVSHIFAKRLPRELDPVTVSGGRVLFGAAVLLPWAAWSGLHGGRWDWSAKGLLLVLTQGLALSSVNLVLWYMAILRMDLAKATGFLLSYPALTLLFSWGLGREPVSPLQAAGLAVTLGGAAWLSRLAARSQETPPRLVPAG